MIASKNFIGGTFIELIMYVRSWFIHTYSLYVQYPITQVKYKENLRSIGIVQIKNKETTMVAYTCRHSSRPSIP